MFFSLITACFTFAASWTKSPNRTYGFQVGQCLVYAIAAYFFGVYACIVMMLINALRNFLLATNRYKASYCFIFTILAVIMGLWVNGGSLAGILTIIATVQYSVCGYFAKKELSVKIVVIINLLLWLCYDLMVLDFFSGTMDIIAAVLAVITIVRIVKDGKDEMRST